MPAAFDCEAVVLPLIVRSLWVAGERQGNAVRGAMLPAPGVGREWR